MQQPFLPHMEHAGREALTIEVFQKAFGRFMEFLDRNHGRRPWAGEAVERMSMFDAIYCRGDDPLVDSIAMQIPLVDMPGCSGKTALEEYLEGPGLSIPAREREFLHHLSMSAMGWYESMGLTREGHWKLRDVTTGRRWTLPTDDLFEEGEPPPKGTILWCRVVGRGRAGMLLCTPIEFPPEAKEDMQRLDRIASIVCRGTDEGIADHIVGIRRAAAFHVCRYAAIGDTPFLFRAFSFLPWRFSRGAYAPAWSDLLAGICRWAFANDHLRFLWAHLFVSCFGDGMVAESGDVARLVQYYLFGYPIRSRDGKTVAELFARSDEAGDLPEVDRERLALIAAGSRFGAFRVKSAPSRTSMDIVSLAGGEGFQLEDPTAARMSRRGDVLVARLFPTPKGAYSLAAALEHHPSKRGKGDAWDEVDPSQYRDEISWMSPRFPAQDDEESHPADAIERVVQALRYASARDAAAGSVEERLHASKGMDEFLAHFDPQWASAQEAARFMQALDVVWKGLREEDPEGETKIGCNAPCPCGSGKKYKWCCLGREGRTEQ